VSDKIETFDVAVEESREINGVQFVIGSDDGREWFDDHVETVPSQWCDGNLHLDNRAANRVIEALRQSGLEIVEQER